MTQGPNPDPPPALDADAESVRRWVMEWGLEVRDVDLAGARHRFADGVVSFGTHADLVTGLDALHDQQWSAIWPHIADFAFDQVVPIVADDRCTAVAVATWSSTGYADDGMPYPRPGRATIVLRRPDVDSEWLGVHTHFSLAHGVPPTTRRPTGERTS